MLTAFKLKKKNEQMISSDKFVNISMQLKYHIWIQEKSRNKLAQSTFFLIGIEINPQILFGVGSVGASRKDVCKL